MIRLLSFNAFFHSFERALGRPVGDPIEASQSRVTEFLDEIEMVLLRAWLASLAGGTCCGLADCANAVDTLTLETLYRQYALTRVDQYRLALR